MGLNNQAQNDRINHTILHNKPPRKSTLNATTLSPPQPHQPAPPQRSTSNKRSTPAPTPTDLRPPPPAPNEAPCRSPRDGDSEEVLLRSDESAVTGQRWRLP